MSEASTQITLIGTKLATIGMEFTFIGATPECDTCKLRNTCINLEPTRRYRVMGTRGELVHDCPIHEAGVRAVEVAESPIIAAFDARTGDQRWRTSRPALALFHLGPGFANAIANLHNAKRARSKPC